MSPLLLLLLLLLKALSSPKGKPWARRRVETAVGTNRAAVLPFSSLIGILPLGLRRWPLSMPSSFHPSRKLALAILAMSLLLGACADPRRRTEKAVEQAGPQQLRNDAARLYKDFFAGHGLDFYVIREPLWPNSFRRLAPVRVGAYPDGLSITTVSTSTGESGVYVVPAGIDHMPVARPNQKFEKIADGLYWYSFGN